MTIYLTEKEAKAAGLVKDGKRKNTRSDIPRGPQGEGDRIAQLMRIAVYGYGPRWTNGLFYFWNPRTDACTSAHDTYAAACIAAEKELGR